MAGDSSYNSVSLLLHGDGANGSTTFTDNSPAPKTITVYGNAQISTTQSKFNSSSMYFDGASDYLTIADNVDFSFGTSDVTVDGWFYELATGAIRQIVGQHSTASTADSSFLVLSDAGKLAFSMYSSTTAYSVTNAASHSLNVWHHYAAVRDGVTLRLFLDGVNVGNTSIGAASINDSTRVVSIGTIMNNSGRDPGGYDFNGYLDDLRITKGVARYTGTSSFTPPTRPYSNGIGEVEGVIRDDAGALCARTVRLMRRDTGAVVASTVSDATTGAYRLATPTLDEVCRIVHDDSAGTLYNDLIDRVIPA